jgi:hypothetical protein
MKQIKSDFLPDYCAGRVSERSFFIQSMIDGLTATVFAILGASLAVSIFMPILICALLIWGG